MLWPGPDSACFYLDPSAGLTDGGLWKDSSRFGLHCTPVGYAAPNWGYSLGPSGAPRIGFNGANQTGALPLRFYLNAPTTAVTFALVARHNNPTAGDRVFSCVNAGNVRGIEMTSPTSARMGITGYDGAVLCAYSSEATDSGYVGRTRVTILAVEQAGSLARRWVDGVGLTPFFLGNVNPIAYDTAVVPTIGTHPFAAVYFDGDLYFLGIWPLVFTDSEAKAFSAFWMDRT